MGRSRIRLGDSIVYDGDGRHSLRQQLIHSYATVNVSTVWNIAQNALPTLIEAVQTLLDELK